VHRIGGVGEVVDWAVHMRRLRDEDRADALLERGELSIPEIDRMVGVIAEMHAEARSDEHTAEFGKPTRIEHNVRENFEQTREAIRELLTEDEASEIERWQIDFLRENRSLFEARIEQDRVRDGHGDLRLEHFYLEGPDRAKVRVIDCIEFNERFRFADVCADLAFLSMDLAWHGRVDLAERALATYARETSDFDLYPLVDFYESYRAYVRGKVATMLAGDEGAPTAARERARRQARRYFLLALAMERRPLLPPFVVAIGGVIASGKSTLADRLGAVIGAPSINTDRIRKHMLGARATDKLYDGSWAGAYDPKLTEEVYAEVRRCASVVVRSGRPVILDASFRSASMRTDARALAEELGVPFRFVECRADPDLCRARLRERVLEESVSDGRLEIFDDFLKKWEPVEELPEDEHLPVDTERPIEETLAWLRDQLPTWPEGLT
jgi:aminoglycoside phosphotransferase family enzyme/predicted kinase